MRSTGSGRAVAGPGRGWCPPPKLSAIKPQPCLCSQPLIARPEARITAPLFQEAAAGSAAWMQRPGARWLPRAAGNPPRGEPRARLCYATHDRTGAETEGAEGDDAFLRCADCGSCGRMRCRAGTGRQRHRELRGRAAGRGAGRARCRRPRAARGGRRTCGRGSARRGHRHPAGAVRGDRRRRRNGRHRYRRSCRPPDPPMPDPPMPMPDPPMPRPAMRRPAPQSPQASRPTPAKRAARPRRQTAHRLKMAPSSSRSRAQIHRQIRTPPRRPIPPRSAPPRS